MATNYNYTKEGVVGKINLTIGVEDLNNKYNEIFKEYAPKMNLKGFRQGKAPRALVEKKFGPSIKADALNKLIGQEYERILKEEKINPISEPSVDLANEEDIDFDKDVTVDFSFELPPEVEIVDLKEVKVKKDEFEVEEKDIEEQIKKFQEKYATLDVKDGKAEKEDYITVDIEITDDEGNEFKKIEDRVLILGHDYLNYEIDDDLIGLSKGDEKTIEKNYEDDFKNEEVAGKKLTFKINAKEVKGRKLADVTDEFVKDVSQYETVEEWKESIKEQLEKAAKGYQIKHMLDKIYDQVIENSKFEIPETFINYGLEQNIAQFKQQFGGNDAMFEQMLQVSNKSLDDFKFMIRPSVERDIKIELFKAELMKEKGDDIKVGDDEINDYINEESIRTGQPKDAIEKQVNEHKQNVIHFLKMRALDEIIVELVNSTKGKKYKYSEIEELEKEKQAKADEKTKKREEEAEKK